MKIFTRVMLALIAGIAALLVLVPATTASATSLQYTTSQDAQYVATLTADGIYSNLGPAGLIAVGHSIAADVYYGVRTPYAEQQYVYVSTPLSVSRGDANEIVNVALFVYLGVPYP